MKRISIPQRPLSCLALATLLPSLAMAGNLEPTAAPSAAASAVYSTDDIYNRLQSGAVGTKRSGGFTEPGAGPADGVGQSLDEAMALAPTPNSSGLKPSETPSGKTFWGLNQAAGSWGPQTGSNANVVDTSEAAAPAAASDISLGKKAFVNGAAVTGTKPNTVVFTCTGTLNGTRWCDRGNGTVRDMTTGLVWLKNANCTTTLNGVTKTSGYLTWDNAETWSAAMVSGQCGLTDGSVAGDWRLPTKSELAGITTGVEPVLSGTPRNFSGVQSSAYWSSTTSAYYPTYAWLVSFHNGNVGSYTKTYGNYVWPVRGGQ